MMPRLAWAGAAALSLLAGGAQALSCIPASVETSYARAAASEEDYIVVQGVIRFDEGKLPKAEHGKPNVTPKETRIEARLNGMAMSRSGFNHPFDREITISVPCLGPWCGGLTSGARYLAFLRLHEAGYELEAGPCGGWAFSGDVAAHAETGFACFKSGRCNESRPARP
ncbi:hypothetical protein DZK27_08685 [Rhodobacteraceae bacterium 63075]|nr:hypothetical protein DZK27_08685 [Rhodobacteraceae bacterium 63075]